MDGFGGGNNTDYNIVLPDVEVDNLVFQIVQSYNSSAKSLWDCAKYTWELFDRFGMYERNFTATLCNNLSVQKETVYHWRKAWDLRIKVLDANPQFSFDGLTISHFYNSADFLNRVDIETVSGFLEVAGEENWSSRKLAIELHTATDESGTMSWLTEKLNLVLSRVEKIFESSEYSGLENSKREKLKIVIRLLNEIVE